MLWWLIPSILIFIFLLAILFAYLKTFYFNDTRQEESDLSLKKRIENFNKALASELENVLNEPFEEVSITSRDNLKLYGKFYKRCDGAPIIIMCHGYKGMSSDFFLSRGKTKDLGLNALVIDQRCHGKSQGHSITFGIKEHLDVLDWINFICNRYGDVPIFLMGVSMGAATVIMTAGKNLPRNVKGVIADCPYDSPAAEVKHVIKNLFRAPIWLLYPPVFLGGLMFGQCNLQSYSPIEAIKKSQVPILLIHGDKDNFVPFKMSENLAKQAPQTATLHLFHGANHAASQQVAPTEYFEFLNSFIKKQLETEKL